MYIFRFLFLASLYIPTSFLFSDSSLTQTTSTRNWESFIEQPNHHQKSPLETQKLFSEESATKKIIPPPLQAGDGIALVLPASKIPMEEIDKCVEALENRGFTVHLAVNAEEEQGFFCGNDDARLRAFTECWLDPEVKAIWCIAGGYGCTRLLPLLDFSLFQEHPKIFIGMSDITALHAVLNRFMVTYLGPVAFQLYAIENEEEKRRIGEESLFAFLENPARHATWNLVDHPQVTVVQKGIGEGELVGGNLTLINALVGTPYEIDTKGKILILEDVNEKTYQIDRKICQLAQSGALDGLAGLILGNYTGCEPRRSESRGTDITLDEVFSHWFADAPYPVIRGFPTGHIPEQETLPLGRRARLDTHQKTLELL